MLCLREIVTICSKLVGFFKFTDQCNGFVMGLGERKGRGVVRSFKKKEKIHLYNEISHSYGCLKIGRGRLAHDVDLLIVSY